MTDFKPLFGEPCGPWIKTFAWLPVFTFDAGRVWFRTVWKRHIFKFQHLPGGPDYWWQYRRFPPETEKKTDK
jgi:hypothetical protein